MASKVMVCHLHKMGSGGTYQMFGAIVVSKWDTMQTHQNVPTTTKPRQKQQIKRWEQQWDPTRWEWSKRTDVHVLPIRQKHPT